MTDNMSNTFNAKASLQVGDKAYTYYRLEAAGDVSRLPYAMKVLLENLLRREDGVNVTAADVRFIADCVDAGFYRRACCGGSGCDARCHGGSWWRYQKN